MKRVIEIMEEVPEIRYICPYLKAALSLEGIYTCEIFSLEDFEEP
jgi:hypothetical protein